MQFQSILRLFILIVSISIATVSTKAQSVKELESQRKQTLQKLETTNKLLNETNKSKRNYVRQLESIIWEAEFTDTVKQKN